MSSDEVERGKPEPDVYLLACERLGVRCRDAVAIEDSGPGILAAKAAGLGVVAVPNRSYPPSPEELAAADLTIGSLSEIDLRLLPRG